MASVAEDDELLATLREGAQATGPRYHLETVYGDIAEDLELAAGS